MRKTAESDGFAVLRAKREGILEFNEKLRDLRKSKGLTQEQLAEAIFVSRTAVSKWESGRGVPNIESLKALSEFFSVSLDSLLSGEELLEVARTDVKKTKTHMCDTIFGLLDCLPLLFLFLPFFGQRGQAPVRSVPLLSLEGTASYVKISYIVFVLLALGIGIALLALQTKEVKIWEKYKYLLSVGVNILGASLFMLTLQPYAALFVFALLVIKAFLLVRRP